jgi:hypothetical protein
VTSSFSVKSLYFERNPTASAENSFIMTINTVRKNYLPSFSVQSLLFTICYRATADLPTSQITRTCYPFPGNGSQQRNYHFKSLWSLLVISSSITLDCRLSRTRSNSPILSPVSWLLTLS